MIVVGVDRSRAGLMVAARATTEAAWSSQRLPVRRCGRAASRRPHPRRADLAVSFASAPYRPRHHLHPSPRSRQPEPGGADGLTTHAHTRLTFTVMPAGSLALFDRRPVGHVAAGTGSARRGPVAHRPRADQLRGQGQDLSDCHTEPLWDKQLSNRRGQTLPRVIPQALDHPVQPCDHVIVGARGGAAALLCQCDAGGSRSQPAASTTGSASLPAGNRHRRSSCATTGAGETGASTCHTGPSPGRPHTVRGILQRQMARQLPARAVQRAPQAGALSQMDERAL